MEFEEYVREQGAPLLRLAFVLSQDAQRAEDLTQTVLGDAYRHWRKVTAARSPDGYIRRMLVNAHLDWHRKRSSREQPSDLSTYEPRASEADIADEVTSRDRLRIALLTLSPRSRTALVLRSYADLDDTAIAEVMGISASTVRSTISRALSALRSGDIMTEQLEHDLRHLFHEDALNAPNPSLGTLAAEVRRRARRTRQVRMTLGVGLLVPASAAGVALLPSASLVQTPTQQSVVAPVHTPTHAGGGALPDTGWPHVPSRTLRPVWPSADSPSMAPWSQSPQGEPTGQEWNWDS